MSIPLKRIRRFMIWFVYEVKTIELYLASGGFVHEKL
jgi:hypothetical protein